MDARTAKLSGIAPENLYELPNGSYVDRGMFKTFGLYKYRPSLVANALFIALYGVVLLLHIYLGIRWRIWGFMTFVIIGCIWSMVGYGGRVMLWINPWSFTGFLTQMICITGCPVFFTAAIYVTLSRAIRFFSPEMSRLPPRAFYWLFISSDIICLVLQSIGGALSSTSSGASETGLHIAMAGLSLQVVVLVVFCGFFADYMIRYIKRQKSRLPPGEKAIALRQRLFFGGLASAITLILIRCCYRVNELSEGYRNSDKITNQGMFIGLEGVLIYLAVVSLLIGNPGFGFQDKKGRSSLQGTDSSGELKESAQVQHRSA
ncbi:unnamed protein product [Clonostachys rosea]|uniref:Uncharacterized protein n=1 Tax=Bionectria ochroleuca TaxID=29856 RepID=A0ABY6U6G8_BIOOC|nr:unnamed protein product [Clonostachys rosea]